MRKGENKKAFAYYEVIPHLKVDEFACPAYLYKRFDTEINKEVEHKSFYLGVPVPNTKNGKRMSLRTSSRERALQLSAEKVIDIRTQLAQGLKLTFTTSEQLARAFLNSKKIRIRDSWEGKLDAGLKSITKERFKLIEGKIRNYFLPFVGASSNAKTLSYKKFDNEWEIWRKNNPSARGKQSKKPKQSTIRDEMGMIREIWNWGIKNGYIEPTQLAPFEDENLVPDVQQRRETFEISEMSDFVKELTTNWYPKQIQQCSDISIQSLNTRFDLQYVLNLIMILAGTGMRPGELFKLKWKDIKFQDTEIDGKHKTVALIQVHESNKTGAREVITDKGRYFEILKQISKKSFKSWKENDFVCRHLDGRRMTTRWLRDQFAKIREDLKLEEKLGKTLVPYSFRHYYATERLYAGVPPEMVADNMGIEYKTMKKFYSHVLNRHQKDKLLKPINRDLFTNIRTRSVDTDNPNEEIIGAKSRKNYTKIIKEVEKNIDAKMVLKEDWDQIA